MPPLAYFPGRNQYAPDSPFNMGDLTRQVKLRIGVNAQADGRFKNRSSRRQEALISRFLRFEPPDVGILRCARRLLVDLQINLGEGVIGKIAR
jgi:hypothetical protein